MRRKRLWTSVALVLGFVALVLVGLVALVKREPSFYGQALLSPGENRKALSQSADARYFRINGSLDDRRWEVAYPADEINAFLQEEGSNENLPDGFTDPRVKMEDGKMRIGLRYGKGLLSTIVALELRLWKVEGEINMLAMEIVSLQAGSLPISKGTLLEFITETVRRQNIEITWFRTNTGHPVAIMRFQANQSRPTIQFDAIELKDGKLVVSGRSMDFVTGPAPRVQK
ncbi:MAG: hypothetical protein EXS09_10030 [Gemmataceae bacterium]|nr:hypothetical protein [Gemmataceae bacterium]